MFKGAQNANTTHNFRFKVDNTKLLISINHTLNKAGHYLPKNDEVPVAPNSRHIQPADYTDILDTVADGVFTVDCNMKITSYNRAAELLTGVPREKALGQPCHQVFRTAVCFNACPVREAIDKQLKIVNREIIMHDCAGEMVPVWVTASVLYDQQGNPIGGVESIRNLSRLYSIIDSVADGLFTVDKEMRITNFNKAAEEITGMSHEEAIGQPCSTVFRTNCCEGGCPLREAIDTRQAIERDVEITDRNGRKKMLAVKAATLFDCTGAAVGGVETLRDMTPMLAIKEEVRQKYSFRRLVSRNAAMRGLFDIMEDIAVSDATVLLHGESGTGKELFAHAIHDLSRRANKPMITVNCGALPETLLESEIFGVRRGAFTGATENRPGRLELCQGGTFFLDEVGDLPLPLQVKLLRVLENHEFQPLGAQHPVKADVRFITATHRNLEEMVANGTFRQDLYFRINIVTLNIPPLRDRRDDIPLLVDMAIERFNLSYNRHIRSVSPEVMKMLLQHPFPGNVRELLNLIEQAVIICHNQQIGFEHLPASFTQSLAQPESSPFSPLHPNRHMPSPEQLHDLLQQHQGNRNAVAQALGIERTTLWRWMKRYGMVETHLN